MYHVHNVYIDNVDITDMVTNVTPLYDWCFPSGLSWCVRSRCGIGGPGQFPHSDQQLDQLHRIAKHRGRFESPLVNLEPNQSCKFTAEQRVEKMENRELLSLGCNWKPCCQSPLNGDGPVLVYIYIGSLFSSLYI